MTKLFARLGLLLVAALALLATTGCGPKWEVVKQANPNPFAPSSKFAMAPPTYEGLMVGSKSEQEYLSEKDANTQQDWQNDKKEMVDAFMDGFNAERESVQTGAGEYAISPHITFIEPGYYAGVAAAPSEVRVDVKIFDKAGALLDEITITAKGGGMSTTQRLRTAAKELGITVAKYLKKRTGNES